MSPWLVKETCERSRPAPLGRAIVIRVLAHMLGTVQLVGKLPTTVLKGFWRASQLPHCQLLIYEWQWFWFEKALQRTIGSKAGAFQFCPLKSPCWLLRLHLRMLLQWISTTFWNSNGPQMAKLMTIGSIFLGHDVKVRPLSCPCILEPFLTKEATTTPWPGGICVNMAVGCGLVVNHMKKAATIPGINKDMPPVKVWTKWLIEFCKVVQFFYSGSLVVHAGRLSLIHHLACMLQETDERENLPFSGSPLPYPVV